MSRLSSLLESLFGPACLKIRSVLNGGHDEFFSYKVGSAEIGLMMVRFYRRSRIDARN
jgi:hypothetical protein